jgi:hypothetical protein
MSTIAGIGGLLNGVAQFQQFSATSTANLQELIHAGTGKGGRQRRPGIKDWNATYNSYGPNPEYWPGDEVPFLGSIDGLVGLSGDCMVIQQAITWTPEGNLPITHVGSVVGMGPLTRGSAVVAEPSPSDPDMSDQVCVELTAVNIDTPTWVKEEDTRQITLTYSVAPLEYSSCSTLGTVKREDALWDVALSYDVYTDDFALLPDEGEPYGVRIESFFGSGVYHLLNWMRVQDLTNMMVNRQTGELVGATVNMMSSVSELVGATTPTETLGEYQKPGGTVWRPEPAVLIAAKQEARNLFVQARRTGRSMMREGNMVGGLDLIMEASEQGKAIIAEALTELHQRGVDAEELVAKVEESTSA